MRMHTSMKKGLMALCLVLMLTLCFVGRVGAEEAGVDVETLSVDEIENLKTAGETHEFEAEVSRLMKLIINSIYTHKEIFLRELISNASDALDKIRFMSLTDKDQLATKEEMEIRIVPDEENNLLHIIDSGVGMTKEELVRNLGTIARSGTSDFIQKLKDAESAADASNLIGQFGVGFYSAYLVADHVTVRTKSNDDDTQWVWSSDAGSYSISPDPHGNTLGRGTQITLHLKEDSKEYTTEYKLKEVIYRYSEFIQFPIHTLIEKEVKEEVNLTDEEVQEAIDAHEAEKAEREDEGAEAEDEWEAPSTKTVTKTVKEWLLMNDNKPIWSRSPSDVTDEEYIEFYKLFAKDENPPLTWSHFKAEGDQDFSALMFVPSKAPANFYQSENFYAEKSHNVRLYIRNVFISDELQEMLPLYLNFMQVIVSAEDLPLNVSRETLQASRGLSQIAKQLTNKALALIKKISKDDEKYAAFWKEFGLSLKLGVTLDNKNKDKISKLLRFPTSEDPNGNVSLETYIERMKPGQNQIYFLSGVDTEDVETSPLVESLRARNIEVIHAVEGADEYVFNQLYEYEGKQIMNAAKEGIEGGKGARTKELLKQYEDDLEPLSTWLKDVLKEHIDKVNVSVRLVDSPCAVVAKQFGVSGTMERMMKAQAGEMVDPMTQFYLNQKKSLEINPRHPIIRRLNDLAKDEARREEQQSKDMARVLFDTAMLRVGYTGVEPTEYAGRIESLLRVGMSIPLDAGLEGEAFPEDEADDMTASDDGPGNPLEGIDLNAFADTLDKDEL
eukprot:Clim_evm31s198 gene=Clim_evmTU31s198